MPKESNTPKEHNTSKKHKMHEGHRERLRQRFFKEGLQNFEQHNVLELLLFTIIPQKDTNELAHMLIERFGSLSGVLDAPMSELQQVDGIGSKTAFFLSMLPELFNVYLQDKTTKDRVSGLDAIADFAANCFIGMNTEHFLLICVDNKNTMMNYEFICEGSVEAATVDVHKIMRKVSSCNATNAVIAHNHPRGNCKPSRADLNITMSIARALDSLHIHLLDHVVVCDDGYLSMAAEPKKYGCYLHPVC